MTTALRWPDFLPCFRFEPYSVAPRSGALQLDIASASHRVRIYTQTNEVFSCEMILPNVDESNFRQFYDNDTTFGTQSFLVDVWVRSQLETWEANFIGEAPTSIPVSAEYVKTQFQLIAKPLGNDLDVSSLIGLSWELPCTAPNDVNTCLCGPGSTDTVTLGGDPGTSYNVTFRVRGVVELANYSGGTQLSPSYFYKNKTGTAGSALRNVYRLGVSSPANDYYINKGLIEGVDPVAIDYEITIPIDAGATVTLASDSAGGTEIDNAGGLTVADDDPARPVVVSQPFDGQFAQIDVLSIVEA